MTLLGSREAFALGIVAIGFRLFYIVYVENPQTLNSGWLLALCAALLVLPMALALTVIGKTYSGAPAEFLAGVWGRIVFAVIMLFGIFDAATSVNLFSHSASYMALEGIPTQWIRLTCVIAAALGCLGGVQAVGSTARVWLRILFWLMLIVVLSVIPSFNVNYLFPVLGPGAGEILKPVLPAAGVVSSVLPIWLLREKPKNDLKRYTAAALCINVGLAAGALLLLTGLMLPPILNYPSNSTFQLDKLLTNGRVSVLLQLPLLFIWFGCYIASLGYSLVFAVRSMTGCFPKLPNYAATVICAGLTLALSFSGLARISVGSAVSALKFGVYTLITVILAAERVITLKRRKAR